MVRTRGGVDEVELPGGCVCYSQKEGLAASVRTIAEEIGPELLLIEPSGIACDMINREF
jgi:G3E family GTPase